MFRLPRGAALVVPSSPPYADEGHVHVVAVPHGYLYCWCGYQILEGTTEAGAPVFGCLVCHQYVDARRVP